MIAGLLESKSLVNSAEYIVEETVDKTRRKEHTDST